MVGDPVARVRPTEETTRHSPFRASALGRASSEMRAQMQRMAGWSHRGEEAAVAWFGGNGV